MNKETPVSGDREPGRSFHFYAKVRVDPEIGPVFNDAVQNWDAHLALLKDFWSTVMLTTGRFLHTSACPSWKGISLVG